MPTVKIPGIGPVEKKWVYISGAFVVGLVGYAYWNKSRADASESEISDYTEGPGYAMDSGVDEYVNPGGSQAPVEEDYITAPTTNAEWAQKAIAFLVDNGYDPIEASIAVGRYMARQTLSSTQANMIRAASGPLGPPPVGSYPITSEPTPTTPTPTQPKLVAPTGLSAHDIGRTTAGFIWNAVSGDRWYELQRSGRSQTYNTASTHVSITGLKPNTRYSVKVRAVGMDKKPGPWSPSRSFRTKK
jgi:hypothetical protein